jgi:hypothetical protein
LAHACVAFKKQSGVMYVFVPKGRYLIQRI